MSNLCTLLQLGITDIAPNYTGSVLGVINTVSNFMGFLAPVLTALIVDGTVCLQNLSYSYNYILKSNAYIIF